MVRGREGEKPQSAAQVSLAAEAGTNRPKAAAPRYPVIENFAKRHGLRPHAAEVVKVGIVGAFGVADPLDQRPNQEVQIRIVLTMRRDRCGGDGIGAQKGLGEVALTRLA